jgi:hypothetical protein
MSTLASHLKIPGAVLLVITVVAYAANYMGPAPRYYPPAENRPIISQASAEEAPERQEPQIHFTEATVQLVLEP